MTMVVSNKQRIHFRFEGERGAFLLLHHGLFGSSQDWREYGFVSELAKEFRLIIMDARGHGRSDKPLDTEAYTLEQLADDVVAIMNSLDIRNLHFLGYSLGALVGFQMLTRHPERMRIAILGGETPFVTEDVRQEWVQRAAALEQQGLEDLLNGLRNKNQLVRHNDQLDEEEGPAALALLKAMSQWPIFEPGRISVNSPVTLFAGMDDPAAGRVESARNSIYRARFVPFPNLNHAATIESREMLQTELVRLLKSGKRSQEQSPGNGRQRVPDRPARSANRAASPSDAQAGNQSAQSSKNPASQASPPSPAGEIPEESSGANRWDRYGSAATPTTNGPPKPSGENG